MNQLADHDTGFDELKDRFARNIYASGKGKLRLEVLRQDLLQNLPEISGTSGLSILDAGAGLGHFGRWLTEKGHKVYMADISTPILELAKQANAKANLDKNIEVINAPIQELPDIFADKKFDLILLHGVIAWMEKPLNAISTLLPLLKPNGRLSVLYFNKDKLILKLGLNGQDPALPNKKSRRRLTPVNPVGWQEFKNFCDEHKLKIHSKAGIRIFYKFFSKFPGNESATFEEYLNLEKRYASQEPFASLGEHTHCLLSCP
jgi:S-adenosylmethionine-dependent methyltransferase